MSIVHDMVFRWQTQDAVSLSGTSPVLRTGGPGAAGRTGCSRTPKKKVCRMDHMIYSDTIYQRGVSSGTTLQKVCRVYRGSAPGTECLYRSSADHRSKLFPVIIRLIYLCSVEILHDELFLQPAHHLSEFSTYLAEQM